MMTAQEPQDSHNHYQIHQQKEKVQLIRLDCSSYLSLQALKQTQAEAHHSSVISADLMSSALSQTLIYRIKVNGSSEVRFLCWLPILISTHIHKWKVFIIGVC